MITPNDAYRTIIVERGRYFFIDIIGPTFQYNFLAMIVQIYFDIEQTGKSSIQN